MIEKKYNRNTRRADRNLIAALILIGVLGAMIAAFFIIRSITNEPETPEVIPPEILEGEDTYLGAAIAYPRIESSGFSSISIWAKDEGGENQKLSFAIQRGGMDVYKNSFYFSYTNANGVIVNYEPEISYDDPYFDYNDLHAAAMAGSSNAAQIPKITYITTALGSLYFDERMDVPTDEASKSTFLSRYGINDDSVRIILEGKNVKGESVSYAVTVGNKTVNGSTYYFTVSEYKDDEYVARPYVYATRSNYLDYALVNFESFLHTTLVAAGLDQDAALEPIFTPGYHQWKNTVYKYRTDKDGNIIGYYFVKDGVEEEVAGWLVDEDDITVVDTVRIMPYESVPQGTDLESYEQLGYVIGADGYIKSPIQKVEFDIPEFAKYQDNKYLVGALVGMHGGKASNTTLTQLDTYKSVVFVITEEETYSYVITAIESVFEGGRELSVGTAAENEAVKITYDYYVAGSKMNKVPFHAVLVLNDASSDILGSAVKEQLKNADVGEVNIPFDIHYTMGDESTAANAIVCKTRVLLREINGIYDSTGRYTQKASESSYVSYTYYIERTYSYGGTVISTDKVESSKPAIVYLSDPTLDENIKNLFLGKEMDDYEHRNLVVTESTSYLQPMRDFYSFDIKSVTSTVKREPVVAFAYSPDIDPFYRESIYENLLENEYGAYELNFQACQNVLYLLGGIGETASTSVGLKGDKTVAVGLTPDVMEKYDLYANTIRFVLPRGLYDADPEGIYDRDVYGSYDTLTFELYISDKKDNGKRYIGSRMYDIVAEVDGATFDFLDASFIDVWARRNIAMVDVDDIEDLKISLDLDDYKGSYNFMFIHKTASNDNGDTKDVLYIYGAVDKTKPYTENEFIRYAAANGGGSLAAHIDSVYENKTGVQTPYGKEGRGVSNFKELLRMMYTTYYSKDISKAEQTAAMSNKMLMKMSFNIKGTALRENDNEYFLEFRRVDDAYVMVTVYTIDKDGNRISEASDFCITAQAFKKIVYSFTELLNAKELDADSYTGVKKS